MTTAAPTTLAELFPEPDWMFYGLHFVELGHYGEYVFTPGHVNADWFIYALRAWADRECQHLDNPGPEKVHYHYVTLTPCPIRNLPVDGETFCKAEDRCFGDVHITPTVDGEPVTVYHRPAQETDA